MKNIVVITSNFMPNPDANGICAYNIINGLKTEINKITCICNKKDNENEFDRVESIDVFRVPQPKHMDVLEKYRNNATFYNKTRKKVVFAKRAVLNILKLRTYPEIEYRREKKILNILDNLEEPDLIIGIFRPYDGIGAALQYKKKHPRVIICGYFLDSLLGAKPFGLKWLENGKFVYKNELSILKKIDIILKPVSDKKFYRDSEIFNKIEFVNFPVFVKAESELDYVFDKGIINIVFIGTLDSHYRTPEYLLEIFNQISTIEPKIHFHFYGMYDDTEELKRWEKEYKDFFSFHGRISYLESRAVLRKADFLVNITNKDLEMIPSKVFELVAQGKPIINVNSNRNDICNEYFKNYPLVCCVNSVEKNLELDITLVLDFIQQAYKKEVDYEQLYLENYTTTPNYICNLIKEKYEEKRRKKNV